MSNFVEKSVSFSEEIRTVEEEVTFIFYVAATGTKWIQCILEVIADWAWVFRSSHPNRHPFQTKINYSTFIIDGLLYNGATWLC